MKHNISTDTQARPLITTIRQACSWQEKNNKTHSLSMGRFPHSSHCKSLQKGFGKFAPKSPIRGWCLPKAFLLCVEISAKRAQQDSRMWLGNDILLYPPYRNVCRFSLRSPRTLQVLWGQHLFPQQPMDIWLSDESLKTPVHVCWWLFWLMGARESTP